MGAQEVGPSGWCGDCGGSTPWGWEAAVLPRGPPQRPIHKQSHRTQERRLTHSTAPHPVQHTYTMHCATARCVSAVSLKHARHAHAQVTRETHHTRCTQAAFLKSSTSPTVLPGAPLREVVSLGSCLCTSLMTICSLVTGASALHGS